MSHIEEIKSCSLVNAKIREQFHIDLNKSIMNQRKAYITEEQRLEYRLEYDKDFYLQNRDKILDYKKEYRENNKEKITEKDKKYYENNKEIIAEKHKNHYENNKEKILEKHKEKMTCACGSTFTKSHKLRHEKSLKHQSFINS